MSENVEATSLESNETEGKVKKPFPLRTVLLSIIGLVVVGVTLTFVLATNNPKTKYFLAEQSSMEHLTSAFEERFGNELDWFEMSKEKPVAHDLELSAEIKQGEWGGFVPTEVEGILNNSSINIHTVSDPEKRQAEYDLLLNIAGYKVDGMQAFVSTEEIIFTLPFLKDYIMLKDADYGKLMETFTGYADRENLGLENFMDTSMYDMFDYEKFEEEYLKYVYDLIPEKAFTESKDSVTVFGDEVNVSKIEMKLTEKELKDLMISLLEKAKDDKDIHLLIEELALMGGANMMYLTAGDIKEAYVDTINDLISQVKESDNKVAINSTIWVKSKDIVKRDLEISTEDPDYDGSKQTLSVKADQSFDKNEKKFDYTFTMEDTYYEDSFTLVGSLKNEKGKIKDSIEMKVEDITLLEYKAEEERNKADHEFDRTFSIDSGWEKYQFNWNGNSKFEKDAMTASYGFTVADTEELAITLHTDIDSKVVKGVDYPNDKTDTIVDIGALDEMELYAFMEEQLGEDFNKWYEEVLFNIMNELGLGFSPY